MREGLPCAGMFGNDDGMKEDRPKVVGVSKIRMAKLPFLKVRRMQS